MKKLKSTAAVGVVVLAMAAALAHAEMTNAQGGDMAGGGQKPPVGADMQRSDNFQEHKAMILDHMTRALADIEKKKACVEAAADKEALQKCLPMMMQGGGMMHQGGGMPMQGGMMQQGGGMPMQGGMMQQGGGGMPMPPQGGQAPSDGGPGPK